MGILTAFILALFIAMLFSTGYRRNGSWGLLTLFFLILFLAGISGQYWIVPFGPVWGGVSFLPMLLFILLIAMLFSTTPLHHHQSAAKTDDVTRGTAFLIAGISIFIWLSLIIFLISVVVGYYR